MGRLLYLNIAIVVTLLLSGSAFAQDDCASIEQARSQLERELAEQKTHLSASQENSNKLTSDLQRAQSEVASLKAKQEAEIAAWATQVTSLQQQNSDAAAASQAKVAELESTNAAKIAKCEAELAKLKDAHAAQLAELQQQLAAKAASHAKVAELESVNAAKIAKCEADLAKLKDAHAAQLADLQQQLAAKGALNASEVLTELAASVSKYVQGAAKCTIDEVKLVVQGLQQGNTTQLNVLAQKVSTSVATTAKAGYQLASAKLDEHLPFVKQRSAEAWQKGSELYQKHVGSAAWVGEVQKFVNNVNAELKSFLTAQIKAQPALKSLDDPVYIQLLSLMIIGAPLLLLFLPVLLWLATLAAPTKNTAAPAGKGSKKGKKAAKAPAAKK